MRRKVLLLVAMALIASLAFAQKSKGLTLDSLTPPGTFMADVGVGWGGLSGGAELMFAQVKIADLIPLTFGAAARAFVDPGIFYTYYSSLSIGVGGFATAHIGFKDFKLPSGLYWLNNVDSYIGLGLGLAMGTANSAYSTYTAKPGFGISTFEGATYYLNDKIGLTAEYGYIGSMGFSDTVLGYTYSFSYPLYYSTFGVTIKL